jgi:hypothetical protein
VRLVLQDMTAHLHPVDASIPKIVHHIWWHGEEHIPARYASLRESFRRLNQSWQMLPCTVWFEYRYPVGQAGHHEPAAKPPPGSGRCNALKMFFFVVFVVVTSTIRIPPSHDLALPPLSRVSPHLLQFMILDHHGGIYCDLDMECVQPLDALLENESMARLVPVDKHDDIAFPLHRNPPPPPPQLLGAAIYLYRYSARAGCWMMCVCMRGRERHQESMPVDRKAVLSLPLCASPSPPVGIPFVQHMSELGTCLPARPPARARGPGS